MLSTTILIAVAIIFFKVLAVARVRVNLIKEQVFQSSPPSLYSAHAMIKEPSFVAMKSTVDFDRQADHFVKHVSQQGNGNEACIPTYVAFKHVSSHLKQTFIYLMN
ncbi:MAG: hypothetical protein R2828_32335 [Saprospiraceae bacterium]